MNKLLEIKTFLNFLRGQKKPKLTTAACDETTEKAIEKMLDKSYSQLPVVKEGRVIGVISYESIASRLSKLSKNQPIQFSDYHVTELMEEETPHMFSVEQDFLSLLETLAHKSYVLIKDDKNIDIITSYDALRYFRTCGENFLLLNDIESFLRKIISERLGSDFEEAERLMYEHAQKEMQKRERKVPKTVDDMEFWEYSALIFSNWSKFKDFFGQKEEVMKHMENARIIRNRTCHFNCLIGVDDTNSLKTILDWLENKEKQE